MPKQSYHHNDLKAELIEKGLKILDEEGYDGFSLRKVAKACNVSQTAPYRHFKNKDELIVAISLKALQSFNRSLEHAVEKHPADPKSQLREMGFAYIQFFVENPEYMRLIFLSDTIQKVNSAGFIENSGTDNPLKHLGDGHPFATFQKTIERYKTECTGEAVNQDELLLYCWGLVHGIAVLINTRGIPNRTDSLQLAKNILWNDKFLT
nr:TetR/AcrR family transcriptional regulator [uncultured Caproiciproducens sp.]